MALKGGPALNRTYLLSVTVTRRDRPSSALQEATGRHDGGPRKTALTCGNSLSEHDPERWGERAGL